MSANYADLQNTMVKAFSISSGIVSVLGSITIIVVLIRSPKRLKSIYRRLVFGMSCMDILHSFGFVLQGLPLPTYMNAAPAVHNAIGNIATCNIQGFLIYTGCMGSVFYDCMLSIYFVMVVVYSKREEAIQKRIEPLFHAVSVLVPVASGLFLLVTTHFNPSGSICWVAPYPLQCTRAYGKDNNSDLECIRGRHAISYRWYFQGYPLILVMLIVILCMLRVSFSIRKQLKKMDKYGASEFAANVERKRRASATEATSKPRLNLRRRKRTIIASTKSKTEKKQTVIQAFLYVSALLLTFLFAFIWNIVRKYWILYFLEMTFLPLLGFFNFFIFIRPRIVMIREYKPELSYVQTFIAAITSKEIASPSGRRASVGNIGNHTQRACGRRSSQTRSSVMSSDILAAARIVQAEEMEKEEEAKAAAMRQHERFLSRKSLQTSVKREDRCHLSTDIIAAAQMVQAEDIEESVEHHCRVSSDVISAARVEQVGDVKGDNEVNEKAIELRELAFGLKELEVDSLDNNNEVFPNSPIVQRVEDNVVDAIEDTDGYFMFDTMENINNEAVPLTEDFTNMI